VNAPATYTSSASQISTAEDCLRKWAGLKIEGLEDKGNRFSQQGSRVHKILEHWFVDATPPPATDDGRIAQAILRHLPPPQTPGLTVERYLTITLGGVPFRGYVDVSIIHERDVPFVSDHKTTSDLVWAKSAEDLASDVQSTLYAADGMLLAAGETELDALPLDAPCDLQWTYGRTRGAPVSLPVVRRVTLEEIRPRLDKTAATATLLRELKHAEPHWLDVPHDASACDKYGGCPFKGNGCNLTPQERIQSIMAQETQHSAFLNKLRNKRANGAGTPTEIHPAPAAVATSSGVVNPPSAPATAAASPPEPEPEPAKKPRKPRQTKAAAAQAAAAQAAADGAEVAATGVDTTELDAAVARANAEPATPAPQATVSASTATAGTRAAQPVAPPVAGAVAGNVLDMLNSQFVAGFKAGFEAGRDS